jgi:hypothetical protein
MAKPFFIVINIDVPGAARKRPARGGKVVHATGGAFRRISLAIDTEMLDTAPDAGIQSGQQLYSTR